MSVALYRFFNESGELLYVGISKTAFERFSQHQGTKEWFSEISQISLEHYPNRYLAAAHETIAIFNEAPRYNILGQSDKPLIESQKMPSHRERESQLIVFVKTLFQDAVPYEPVSQANLINNALFLGLKPSRTTVLDWLSRAESRGLIASDGLRKNKTYSLVSDLQMGVSA